jgi:hypothetical protein
MYTHYRGTTFSFTGQLQNDGVPVDLTGGGTNPCVLTANVFDKAGVNLYGNLVVTAVIPTQGIVNITYADTSEWPVGIARMDSLLTYSDGTTIASDPDYMRIAQTPMVG